MELEFKPISFHCYFQKRGQGQLWQDVEITASSEEECKRNFRKEFPATAYTDPRIDSVRLVGTYRNTGDLPYPCPVQECSYPEFLALMEGQEREHPLLPDSSREGIAMTLEQPHIERLREVIEEQYQDHPTGCGGSFGELLCWEIHENGQTFEWLARKWGISLPTLGDLISDHCRRLEPEPRVQHD